jgi:hypothetical protein
MRSITLRADQNPRIYILKPDKTAKSIKISVNAKPSPFRATGGFWAAEIFSGGFLLYDKRRLGLRQSIASWTRRRLIRMKLVAS